MRICIAIIVIDIHRVIRISNNIREIIIFIERIQSILKTLEAVSNSKVIWVDDKLLLLKFKQLIY